MMNRHHIVDHTVVQVMDNMLDNVVEEIHQENCAKIHSNPVVVDAVLRFEKGDMEHKIARCGTCLNVSPLFHSTKGTKERSAGILTLPSVGR